ncbi:MAG: cation transporter [Bradyrhizobiaceae bacterium]|nr:cation transporter [Bradyrhizobiaceae bacterium]
MLLHIHTPGSHDHGHEHGHGHGHHHHHHISQHADIRPIRIAIVLTTVVLLVQFIGGIISNSLALLSDTGHVFVDLASLLIAYFGLRIAARNREQHSERYTFGLRRLEVIAALTNGFILVGMCIFIMIEAVERFSSPEHVHAHEMLYVAIVGFIANGISAWYLQKSQHITTRSAYLHVLTDLMSSAGVIIGAIILLLTDWTWVDPVLSLVIALLIMRGAFRVIKEASIILMESAPEEIDVTELTEHLTTIPGVIDVHDVHVWQLSQDNLSATVHVVTEEHSDTMIARVKDVLNVKYRVSHATIQIESTNLNDSCGA